MEPIRRRYFLFDSWRPTVRDQLRRTRMPTLSAAPHRPRVVIVGAGFGGLSAAKALGDAPVDVTVIDLHNYHLFQPLLYQVATAGLSPADIAAPIRSVLRGQSNTSVMLAKVTGDDWEMHAHRIKKIDDA